LFPPALGVSIDYGKEQNLTLPFTPDVLVFNSDLQHFAKVCICLLYYNTKVAVFILAPVFVLGGGGKSATNIVFAVEALAAQLHI